MRRRKKKQQYWKPAKRLLVCTVHCFRVVMKTGVVFLFYEFILRIFNQNTYTNFFLVLAQYVILEKTQDIKNSVSKITSCSLLLLSLDQDGGLLPNYRCSFTFLEMIPLKHDYKQNIPIFLFLKRRIEIFYKQQVSKISNYFVKKGCISRCRSDLYLVPEHTNAVSQDDYLVWFYFSKAVLLSLHQWQNHIR